MYQNVERNCYVFFGMKFVNENNCRLQLLFSCISVHFCLGNLHLWIKMPKLDISQFVSLKHNATKNLAVTLKNDIQFNGSHIS